jgi:hypothetical protein
MLRAFVHLFHHATVLGSRRAMCAGTDSRGIQMDDSRGGLGLADSGAHEKPALDSESDEYVTSTTQPTDHQTKQPLSEEPTDVISGVIPTPAAKFASLLDGITPLVPHVKKPLRIWPRSRAKQVTIIASLVLLVALAIPTIYTITTALNDYQSLKALGLDGVAHLSAAKSDLLGESNGNSSSGSSLGSLSGSSLSSGLLGEIQTVLEFPGPDVTNPAYTYVAQRQGGTKYPIQVTVHPAKGVSAEGTKTTTFKATVNTNTYFALGGTPKPTPTPAATTTPTVKPSPTATTAPNNGSSDPGGLSSRIPDQAHIDKARADLLAAQQDFLALGSRLDHPDEALSLAAILPIGKIDLNSARVLATVGVDATQAGLAILDAATPLMLRLHGTTSLLSGTTQLITEADITALSKGLAVVSVKVDDIVAQLKQVDVSALPLSASQKALFTAIQPLLPQIKSLADQAVPLLQTFGWIVGAATQRTYLVQLQDTGELRSAGGFTGQYALLALGGGKFGSFYFNYHKLVYKPNSLVLMDVNCLDYGGANPSCASSDTVKNYWAIGRLAPAPYNTWWPFPNWGMRDSSLSVDFPTNANIVINAFQNESGQKVDGLIDISPLAIEDVLRVVGSIVVPRYNVTITADNLITKLHYFQQDPAAIALQNKLDPGQGRKAFTNHVGQLLQQKVKSLPLSMMAPLVEQMFADMRAKNILVYFKDQDSEALLAKYDLAGAVNTTAGQDGYLLDQNNVSVSKAADFVNVAQSDNVTLDAKGGATHHLTVTFHGNYIYNQVYGFLTYIDYLRFYVPANAKLLGGSGFDSLKPMCWPTVESLPYSQGTVASAPYGPYATLPTCASNPYPNGELYCPAGNYGPGPRSPSNGVWGGQASNGHNEYPVDVLTGPSSTKSDIAGRAMYAGYIIVPDGCTATVTLSWYVPGVAPKV